MANDKKMVEAITSMDVDFAQWYTDVVKKSGVVRLRKRKRMHGHQAGGIRHLGKYPERTG